MKKKVLSSLVMPVLSPVHWLTVKCGGEMMAFRLDKGNYNMTLQSWKPRLAGKLSE